MDKNVSNIKILFGKKIKKYRLQKELSQEQLAEKVGIAVTNMGKIERGESFVTASTLEKLCNVLDVNVKNVFDFEYSKTVDEMKNEINLSKLNEEKLYLIYKIYKFLIEDY